MEYPSGSMIDAIVKEAQLKTQQVAEIAYTAGLKNGARAGLLDLEIQLKREIPKDSWDTLPLDTRDTLLKCIAEIHKLRRKYTEEETQEIEDESN